MNNVLQGLFYRGTDSGVWTRWRKPDGSWSGEERLGGVLIGDPIAAAVPGTNVLQVFYRGTDGAMWTRWRQPDGRWSGEHTLGGVVHPPPHRSSRSHRAHGDGARFAAVPSP